MKKVSRWSHTLPPEKKSYFFFKAVSKRINGISGCKLSSLIFPSLFRLILTKPELMRPTNVQQRCWEVVKRASLYTLLNAVGQDSSFMLFSSRSAHRYPSAHPHCECCLVSPVSFPTILCVFHSLGLFLSKGCI